jgi:hypothetical protein
VLAAWAMTLLDNLPFCKLPVGGQIYENLN